MIVCTSIVCNVPDIGISITFIQSDMAGGNIAFAEPVLPEIVIGTFDKSPADSESAIFFRYKYRYGYLDGRCNYLDYTRKKYNDRACFYRC